MNEFFKNDKLFITKNCVNTIREIQNWKWKKLKPLQAATKNEPDEPMDKDEHSCDCLRYLVMSRTDKADLNDKENLSPDSAWGRYVLSQKKKDDFVYQR